MKIIYSDVYDNLDIGDHPWDVNKYKSILKRLLDENSITSNDIIRVDWADEKDILHVHSLSYLDKMETGNFSPEEERLLELPVTSYPFKLYQLFSTFAEGTIKACEYALKDGISVHLGGGKHHAFSTYGTGFCMINDLAVAARTSQENSNVKNILIADCDLHQGNGTADIFKNDSSVFTFSIHQKNLFPYYKEKSDLDIELENRTDDDTYLSKLQDGLQCVFDVNQFDLIIYQAGADPYTEDPLGQLNISIAGLRKRDELIFSKANENNIPIAVTLGGGYSDRVVDIHCNTVYSAQSMLENNLKSLQL